MTRVFSRDCSCLSEGLQVINMTVKDKNRIVAVFSASFVGDSLSSFYTLNFDMPIAFIAQETTRFMTRAYSIISDLDSGFLEFELSQVF